MLPVDSVSDLSSLRDKKKNKFNNGICLFRLVYPAHYLLRVT